MGRCSLIASKQRGGLNGYLRGGLNFQSTINQQPKTSDCDRARYSEEKLAVTLSSIGDAVIATDAQARVTLLNPVAQDLIGWTQEQAVGRLIDDVFHIISRDTRQRIKAPVASTLAHGVTQGLANHTVLISRDNQELHISDSCAPIRDAAGVVVGAVLVFRNVTKEYAVQQSLQESSALVQIILNTVVDGIVTIHAHDGTIETANPAIAKMFGYSVADLEGKHLSLLIPELDPQHNVSMSSFMASDAERAIGAGREVTGRRHDGSDFPLEISVSQTVLRGQRYLTGVLRDVTTRNQAEAERSRLDLVLQKKNDELRSATRIAENANLAKSEFLSSMSHELRSPLNAILGFAQLLESGTPPPTPTQMASIAHILKGGWYLLELINEILDLSLIESGRLSLSLEPISLCDVFLDCEAMIETQARQKGIGVTFAKVDDLCYVHADRTRTKQILINLLSNAIKYNRPGGTVDVTYIVRSSERIRVSVQDHGEGLSPHKITQLFQPFNRLGQEGGSEEGTGIGLVVCRRLVELMAGEMGVSSVVGVGSVFWFELNLAKTPQWEVDVLKSSVLAEEYFQTDDAVRTVLYVEDNKANMELVLQLVSRRPDLRLLGAIDAMRGVALARAHLPRVILMDINLPGISGMQALQILREDPTTQHIPVLALSANAMPHDIEKGLEAGFFRYLTKPIKVNEFMAALDEGLALSESHQDGAMRAKAASC